jgi:PAS domain S-box-containing protein
MTREATPGVTASRGRPRPPAGLRVAPDATFDAVTRVAARALAAPIALITFVDDQRQVFKSSVGVPAEWAVGSELPLEDSICRHVVAARRPVQITDAQDDPLVRSVAGVREGMIGAYLGVPLLLASGEALGALCVIDHVPREWTGNDLQALDDLALTVMTRIELEAQREEIVERDALFRAAIDHSAAPMAIADLSGVRLMVNRALASFLGYAPEELVGRDARRDTLPDDRTAREADIRRIAGGAAPTEAAEYRYVHCDGRLLWGLTSVALVRGTDGAPKYLVVQIQDVTARRRAEDAIRAADERYRLLFQQSPIPMWVFDEETRYFVDVNAAAVAKYGYSAAEFLSMRVADLVADDASQEIAEPVRQGNGSWQQRIVHHRARDGRTLTVDVVSQCTSLEGRAARFVLAQDVSERVRTEAQRRHAQKMEAVGQLAAGVAHDFNNLLTVIAANAELAMLEAPASVTVQETLIEIRRAVNRGAELTHQLLAFGRRQLLEPRVVRLNDVVTDAERMLRRVMGVDVTLETRLEPTNQPVLADPGQLEQVLVNLVVNARDAMPHGGTIMMQTESVVLAPSEVGALPGLAPGRYSVVRVRDTGIGMDATTMARVFEPFFTTKTAGEGSGLGLATAYGIVKQSGGYLHVSSAVGVGSTFSVYLPVITGRDERSSSATATISGAITPAAIAFRAIAPGTMARPGTFADGDPDIDVTTARGGGADGARVLLVEDEPSVRAAIARILRADGYWVIEAEHGMVALTLPAVVNNAFDLVVTDLAMPAMGGRELIQILRRRDPTISVLFVSAFLADDARAGLPTDDACAFLAKPFESAEVSRVVRRLLNRRRDAGFIRGA